MDYDKLNLFSFFRSKARTAILVEFMINSKEKFYIRELERLLNIPVGNVRRELINLEGSGIVRSEKIGNAKFYSVDIESPIYKSIRDIVLKTAGIPKLLSKEIYSNQNIAAAFIFGSYAKGGFDNASDVDLFILTEKNSRVFEEISESIDYLEKRFGREINLVLMQKDEFFKKKKANDPFLSEILDHKKIYIKGGVNDFRQIKGDKTKN